MNSTLTSLIARLEAAVGGDRELDGDIWWAVNRREAAICYNNAATGLPKKWDELPAVMPGGMGRLAVRSFAPTYSSSLDAAFSLIPDGWRLYSIQDNTKFQGEKYWHAGLDKGNSVQSIRAATPALALTIAALKAREA